MVWPQTRLQNGFLQPTKWYGTNSTLQNGVPLSTILDLFFSNDFDIFIQKWSNMCIPAPKKTPGPFCKASTLSGTQLQGQFFRSHFVGFFTLSQFHPKLISKNVSQFLHVAKPYFFLQTICWHSGNKLKQIAINIVKHQYLYRMVNVLERWVLYKMAS